MVSEVKYRVSQNCNFSLEPREKSIKAAAQNTCMKQDFLESSVILCCVSRILILAHNQNPGHGFLTHNFIFVVANIQQELRVYDQLKAGDGGESPCPFSSSWRGSFHQVLRILEQSIPWELSHQSKGIGREGKQPCLPNPEHHSGMGRRNLQESVNICCVSLKISEI